jgi:hypothetical protein
MQILLGLSPLGQVRHTELLASLCPIQMLSLARLRRAYFECVEIWEETTCVLRLPPLTSEGRPIDDPAADAPWRLA